jgi:hypothetical protein
MSSNSSSPVEDKNFLTEDSADVPILAVTAELPVDVDGRSAAQGGGGGNPGHEQGRNEGPGAEPGPTTDNGPTDVGRALATIAALEQTHLDGATLAPLPDQSETMPSPFENVSDDSDAVMREASATTTAAENEDSSPDVLTSAVLPRMETPLENRVVDELEERATSPQASAEAAEELDPEVVSALDATDLVIDGDDNEAEAEVEEQPTPGPQLGAVDEDFLRRVVLPPLPREVRTTAERMAIHGVPGVADDHTAISEPPSPELLASLAVPPRAPLAPPLVQPQSSGILAHRRTGGVQIGYLPLFGLLLLAVGVGTVLPSRLRQYVPAPVATTLWGAPGGAPAAVISAPVATERAPVAAKVDPAPPATAPTITPVPAKAVAPTSPPVAAEPTLAKAAVIPAPPSPPARPAATARQATKATKAAPTKRVRKAKRAAKKAFVDPFE